MKTRLGPFVLGSLLALLLATAAHAARRPVEIVTAGTYPELRVRGQPFFPHSTAFFYDRIPRAMWSRSLDRHRELGLNTIDIYIPWNWHEPFEGRLDFDGRSNPRRDLRGLLRLVRQKGFALIARPGPVILNEWRNGGYPDWLLERPEYEMSLGDVLEGRYPPLAGLGTRDNEKAAELWLANPTHLRYTRRWFAAVCAELERFRRAGGVLLAIQLDDDQALGRANTIGPNFWRYMETLRRFLADGFRQARGRLDVPVFFNPTDPRLPAAGFDPALPAPIAIMGQWYEDRQRAPTLEAVRLGNEDRATIEFFAQTLALQPAFPPMIIEFQAGWYAPGDDAASMRTDPRNTLLASRLLFAHGLRGLNYFPLQDTLTPAGYEVPWANRSYAWDAPLALTGREQERATAVRRNGDLVRAAGPWLAAAHKHADVGLIYPLSSFDQSRLAAEDILAVSRSVMRIARLAERAGVLTSYVDPLYQPETQLARSSVLLVPVFEGEKFAMSERVVTRLENYVRQGGRLVFFPRFPEGALWTRMLAEAGLGAAGEEAISRGKLGQGELFLLRAEPPPAGDKSTLGLSGERLRRAPEEAGVKPVLRVEVTGPVAERVDASLLESRSSPGWSFVALTNLDYETAAEVRIEVDNPRGQGRMALGQISLPAADSLFLPLRLPLCAWGGECEEEIVWATAELAGVAAAEGELITTWYAPGPAMVVLRLPERPERVAVDGREVAFEFDESSKQFRVALPAGGGPLYRRELRVTTGYEMDLPAPARLPRGELEVEVESAVTFPVREGVELRSEPALIAVEGDRGMVSVAIHNRTAVTRSLELSVASEALVAGRSVHVEALAYSAVNATVPLKLQLGTAPGLHRATLHFGEKSLPSRTIFLAVRPHGRVVAYRYDLDRDGFQDWILENDELRVVLSPAAGARSFLLLDKRAGTNWFTNAGGLRDRFAFYRQPEHINRQRLRGMYGLHNRSYACEPAPELTSEGAAVGVRCRYRAPDVLPSGAEIVKSITLRARKLEIDYEVRLDAGGDAEARAAQAFIAAASLPAEPGFSWRTAAADSAANRQAIGQSADLPRGAVRIDRGASQLILRYEGAEGRIERKPFSYWIEMRFPPVAASGSRYRVEYELWRAP